MKHVNVPGTSLDYTIKEPILWLVSLQFGDGIVVEAETKELARAKANQLGIGIYSSPIDKIDKFEAQI